MERPAVQKQLDDVRARKIDVIVVYKVGRLTRSLGGFARPPVNASLVILSADVETRTEAMVTEVNVQEFLLPSKAARRSSAD